MRRFRRLAPAMAFGAWCAGPALAAGCLPDVVTLRGDWGQLPFTVEVADDDQERARGLMFRESMPRTAGMLFVFEFPQRTSFWMQNTLIPLDMIFIDQAGVVSKVHSNAVPGDTTPIFGGDQVFAVLEINGGLAKRYGIDVGTQIRHAAFGENAAWPCE